MEQNDRRDDGSRANRRVGMDPTDGTERGSEPTDELSHRQDRGEHSPPPLTRRERDERWPIG